MKTLKKLMKKYTIFLFSTVTILVIITSVTSCVGCNNPNIDKENSNIDENTDTDEPEKYDLELEGLNEGNSIPSTNGFIIKIKKTDGSAIKAEEMAGIKIIVTMIGDAAVASIGNGNTLSFADSELQATGIIQKKIMVILGSQETEFNLQLQYHGKNIGKAKTAKCKAKTVLTDAYTLAVSKDIIDDGSTEVKITVIGTKELQKEDLDKLSLHIERTKGDSLTVDGATKDASGYYYLALQDVHALKINDTNKKEATKELKLISGKDKQAELKIGLLDEKGNTLPSTEAIIKWSNGAKLEFQNLVYNATDKKVTGTIHNAGKSRLAANEATLHWDIGNDKVEIKDLRQGSKKIAEDVQPDDDISFELENVTIKDPSISNQNVSLKLKWNKLEQDVEGVINFVIKREEPHVYFEYFKPDFPYMESLISRFPFPVESIGELEFEKIMEHPCILFTFKELNARLDTDPWKDPVHLRYKVTRGNVVLVIMHTVQTGQKGVPKGELEQLNLNSGLWIGTDKYKPIIFEHIFENKRDMTGMGNDSKILPKQEGDELVKEVEQVVKMLKMTS